MHFNNQAIGADGQGRPAGRRDQIAPARSV
jgi:hypothetical protein